MNTNGSLRLRVGCRGTFVNSSSGLIRPNQFHHLSVITSSAGEASAYLDGVLVIDPLDIRGGESIGTGHLVIGAAFSGGLLTNYTQGVFDEVAVWDRALSASEVQQLYRRGANRIRVQVKSCVDAFCHCKSFGAAPLADSGDCYGDGLPNEDDGDDTHRAEFIGSGGDGTTDYS